VSSHHIVRDQQEPALILADLVAFPFDLLGQLLEWAPFTVCGEDALDQALAYGINLDVVFSDRPDVEELLAHFPSIVIVRPKENWIEEAILLLAAKGHKAVNMIASDNAMDLDVLHRMSSLILMDIVTPTKKYIRAEKEFSKWLPAGSRIHIIGAEHAQIDGRRLTEEEIDLRRDGLVQIISTSPFIIGQAFS